MVDALGYFGNNGVISLVVTPYGGSAQSSEEIAAVQNIKISMDSEINEMYGMGTTARIAAAKHGVIINVSFEYLKVKSPDFYKYIIDATGGGLEYKEDGTGDTTGLASFDIMAAFTSEDGTNTKTLTVSNVVFKSFPLEASVGDWVKVNLEGTGSAIKEVNSTPASAPAA